MSPVVDTPIVLLLLPFHVFSLAFWPTALVLALLDRWRPSSVLSTRQAALLTAGLALSFGLHRLPLAFPLTVLTGASIVVLAVDFALARRLSWAASAAIVAVAMASTLQTSNCPHATAMHFKDREWLVRGEWCGNGRHVGPWWWTLYRYP